MSARPPSAPEDEEALIAAAAAARRHARAPYSQYAVGAALKTASGKIYTGCNIENASFGLTMCAERVALFKAISEGETAFACIAVAVGGDRPATPCGPCRQLLWEFCGDIPVTLAAGSGARRRLSVSQLLPAPFDDDNLAAGD
jgi:cytidine deaminase